MHHNTIELKLERPDTSYTAYLVIIQLKKFYTAKDEFLETLHPNELKYYNKLIVDKRRSSYLLGRYTAKKAVAEFLNINNLSEIEIASGIFSNPIVRYISHIHPRVSITHDDLYAGSISYPDIHPMSLDIETANQEKITVIKTQLTEKEEKLKTQLNIKEEKFYTLLWTIKEAISKSIRCGLTIPFKLLEVKDLKQENDNLIVCKFENFGQYHSYSYIFANQVISIALPRKTKLHLDPDKLRIALSG